MSEAQFHTLFAGAPHFSISDVQGRRTPRAAYPWDSNGTAKNLSDSLYMDEPAFSAATLHQNAASVSPSLAKGRKFKGYQVDVVELPNMLTAQGVEPGSIGFTHFLELPKSDSLVSDLEQSESSRDFVEASRNKELMQTNPERLGIRPVQLDLIYDRLLEFQDLYEVFHDSPGPMTIVNHQSSGDLYANLFSKLLTPPGFDGTDDDPTGLAIQIKALLKILGLPGIWFDFSLVEYRIKLGQILWSDPEPVLEHEPFAQWTEREMLLLQITLACELLLRLDALTIKKAHEVNDQDHVAPDDIRGFFKLKSKKIDWDLVLAQRFLENILVINDTNVDAVSSQPDSRDSKSLIGANAQLELSKANLVILPRHQSRFLSGLTHFAETLRWPDSGSFLDDLAQKLGINDTSEQIELGSSTSGRFFEPATPSAISVYATPLTTPRSSSQLQDSYFGQGSKPSLNRNDSPSLRIPLSSSSISSMAASDQAPNSIGGWLSRSFLTGLILPGEPISHFLISTLLENDKSALASLGDSANLYGGFTWAERTWWSKTSIVGRVLACLEGSAECMGWISTDVLPEGVANRWHSIQSDRLPYTDRLRAEEGTDLVALDSAVVPEGHDATSKWEDFVFPSDYESVPLPSLAFKQWELMPLNLDLMDTETMSGPPLDNEAFVATFTFASRHQPALHTLSLTYDIQFVTSWPCTPAATPAALANSVSQISKSVLVDAPSRASSRRETLSRRNSHGFQPLLSHPPESVQIAPQRRYSVDAGDLLHMTLPTSEPMFAHPLHKSYSYKIIPVTEVLQPKFVFPSITLDHEHESSASMYENKTILVLDARASADLELLARAWCAEKGFHAVIGRVERTCLACCVREARGLGINTVIRV